MAIRVVNGNTFTEDGWPLVDQAGCTWITIPGTNPTVRIQVQSGLPANVLGAWEADWNAYIERLEDPTTGCWTEGNSVLGGYGKNNGSNHLGGTAVDSCWERHPMGPEAPAPAAGFSQAQYDEMQRMKAYYTFTAKDGTVIQVVWWANDWDTPHDSMHSQMGYGTYKYRDEVAAWAAQHIRPDGFSTYRRGAMPATPPAAQILANATGLTLARATQILPTVTSGLRAAQCTNVNRIAMALAQWGEESAGFSTTIEFASGAEYEGRCSDLGNCSPGDGVKYKGRTWIQITGKAHYREFSAWAFGKGLCASPTQFVDNPTSLGDLWWAGIGAAWYWTVSRPQINALCDAGDIVGVTRAINGGTNGLQDRTARYNRALPLGDQLLTLTTTGDDIMSALSDDEQREMLDLLRQGSKYRRPSLSAFRHVGEGDVNTCMGFAWSADGSTHVQLVERLAVEYGDPTSVALLMEVAAADPVKYPDRAWDANHAARLLAKVSDAAKADANAQIAVWLTAETKS